MSDRTTLLQDILKGLANSPSLSGSVLLTDSNGNLRKSNRKIMTATTGVTDLCSITEAGFFQPVSNAAGGPPGYTVNSSDQALYLGTETYGIMIFFSLNSATIFKRSRLMEWGPWFKINLTKVE